jgi:ABC-2 type transport system permease protein
VPPVGEAMPIHNPGYLPCTTARVTSFTRWWTICVTGIVRTLKSTWLKRLLFAAFLPLLAFAAPFLAFEQSYRDPQIWRGFTAVIKGMPQSAMLSASIGELPAWPDSDQFSDIRHGVWSFMLLTMLRYPQSFLIVLIVGIVAPPLISQDLRTRAYLIYFSRPITRLEYILGKVGVVAFFLVVISALPALILYVVGLLLSPSLGIFFETWDLPLRVMLASIVLVIPTTLVALAISSLTLESRYAAFAWFAIWIVGHVTYSALTAIPSFEAQRMQIEYQPGWRILTSPYQILGNVQAYIFGFGESVPMAPASFAALLLVSAVSLMILFRRVNAPMRV